MDDTNLLKEQKRRSLCFQFPLDDMVEKETAATKQTTEKSKNEFQQQVVNVPNLISKSNQTQSSFGDADKMTSGISIGRELENISTSKQTSQDHFWAGLGKVQCSLIPMPLIFIGNSSFQKQNNESEETERNKSDMASVNSKRVRFADS